MKTKLTTIAILSLFIFGCSEKYSNDTFLSEPPEYYDAWISQGWQDFETGKYSDALDAFSSAAERNATRPGVFLGLGWSSIRNQQMANGNSYLGSALAFAFLDSANMEQITLEAKAGMAGIALASGEYDKAIGYVDDVLSANDAFVFSHDSNVDKAALKKIKATAAYYQGDFALAYQQLVDLNMTVPGVTHEAPNGAMNATAQATGTTPFDGQAKVLVPAAHQLVLVNSVSSANATYEVISTNEGSNDFMVYGNPALSTGDALSVDYYYTSDFGKFLSDLLDILN